MILNKCSFPAAEFATLDNPTESIRGVYTTTTNVTTSGAGADGEAGSVALVIDACPSTTPLAIIAITAPHAVALVLGAIIANVSLTH